MPDPDKRLTQSGPQKWWQALLARLDPRDPAGLGRSHAGVNEVINQTRLGWNPEESEYEHALEGMGAPGAGGVRGRWAGGGNVAGLVGQTGERFNAMDLFGQESPYVTKPRGEMTEDELRKYGLWSRRGFPIEGGANVTVRPEDWEAEAAKYR